MTQIRPVADAAPCPSAGRDNNPKRLPAGAVDCHTHRGCSASLRVLGERHIRLVAFATIPLGLVIVVAILAAVAQRMGPLVYLLGAWPPPLGVALRADGLSAVMLAATAVVISAVAVYAGTEFSVTTDPRRIGGGLRISNPVAGPVDRDRRVCPKRCRRAGTEERGAQHQYEPDEASLLASSRRKASALWQPARPDLGAKTIAHSSDWTDP